MAVLLSRHNAARTLLVLLLLLSCVGCDQVTKELARTYLAFQPPLSCCHDVVRLHYAENAGAFLGLGWNLPEETRILVFQFAVGIGLLALFVVLLQSQNQPHGFLIAWTLILSGGIGNVLDRLLHHGRVTDFMNLGVGSLRTGIFNVADVFITVGVLWLLLALRQQDPPREVAK
ncbi:MAG: Lipoprotein signal peptidase [Nitrospira sp.]